jgi:hypothetical protein
MFQFSIQNSNKFQYFKTDDGTPRTHVSIYVSSGLVVNLTGCLLHTSSFFGIFQKGWISLFWLTFQPFISRVQAHKIAQ